MKIKTCLMILILLGPLSDYAESAGPAQCLGQMSSQDMPFLLIILIFLVSIPIASVITAFMLRIAIRWALSFEIPYRHSYMISLVISLVVFLFYILRRLMDCPALNVPLLVTQFFIMAWVYGLMIKKSDSMKPIGFGPGLLVSFCMVVVGFILFLIIGFLGLIVTGLMKSY